MDRDRLTKFITTIPGGRFFRLRYITHLPVKAKFEKEGITVSKIVNVTTRTGVSYKAIMHNQPQAQIDPPTDNWDWEVKNRIKYNKNTKRRYLVIAPIKGNKNSSIYILTLKNGSVNVVSKDEIKDYIIDSYWRKETERPINNILMDNILSIY